jgi:hypothetical protein
MNLNDTVMKATQVLSTIFQLEWSVLKIPQHDDLWLMAAVTKLYEASDKACLYLALTSVQQHSLDWATC